MTTLKTDTQSNTATVVAPSALMILGTHCPHCPAILKQLSGLLEEGKLGRLNIINLEQHPEEAQQYRVRSVPWVRIGNYELHGAQTRETMLQRIKWTSEQTTLKNEFDYLLTEAQVNTVIEKITADHSKLSTVIDLLADPNTILSTRIGIGVVMEEFAGTALLNEQLDTLATLANHKDARIRADACHYLSFTENKQALAILAKHQEDPSDEVKEVVADSIEALNNPLT
jgi:thiol-disulfide isomerase/thioredoxin